MSAITPEKMSMRGKTYAQTIEVVEPRKVLPGVVWACVGVAWAFFSAYILAVWLTSSDFKTVPTGPDLVPEYSKIAIWTLQIALPIIGIWMLWHFAVRPLVMAPKGERRMTFDGMLAVAWWVMYFPQDAWLNYTGQLFLFNSYAINFGSWYNATPGWTSPNAQLLPEPVLIWGFGYIVFLFTITLFTNWVMKKWVKQFPRTGFFGLLAVAYVTSIALDWVMEMPFLRLGLYAYGGAPAWMTVWAGKTYQWPAYEWLILPMFPMAAMAMFRFYHVERGINPVLSGIEKLKTTETRRQILRMAAIYGFAQMSLLCYNIPVQWAGTHIDSFPAQPSYMLNRMCGPDSPGNVPCPTAGAPIPRRP